MECTSRSHKGQKSHQLWFCEKSGNYHICRSQKNTTTFGRQKLDRTYGSRDRFYKENQLHAHWVSLIFDLASPLVSSSNSNHMYSYESTFYIDSIRLIDHSSIIFIKYQNFSSLIPLQLSGSSDMAWIKRINKYRDHCIRLHFICPKKIGERNWKNRSSHPNTEETKTAQISQMPTNDTTKGGKTNSKSHTLTSKLEIASTYVSTSKKISVRVSISFRFLHPRSPIPPIISGFHRKHPPHCRSPPNSNASIRTGRMAVQIAPKSGHLGAGETTHNTDQTAPLPLPAGNYCGA